MKICIKLRVLAIGCSSVDTGEGVYTGDPMGRGGQQWDGGATERWGSKVGVSSISKNRHSQHKYKYKSPKQFELKQSWKALRALNARWAPPVYPVFENEKSKASDEKSVKRKIA